MKKLIKVAAQQVIFVVTSYNPNKTLYSSSALKICTHCLICIVYDGRCRRQVMPSFRDHIHPKCGSQVLCWSQAQGLYLSLSPLISRPPSCFQVIQTYFSKYSNANYVFTIHLYVHICVYQVTGGDEKYQRSVDATVPHCNCFCIAHFHVICFSSKPRLDPRRYFNFEIYVYEIVCMHFSPVLADIPMFFAGKICLHMIWTKWTVGMIWCLYFVNYNLNLGFLLFLSETRLVQIP